jgi:hypothetical protein
MPQAWCKSKEDGDFELLEKYLDNLKPEECILVRNIFFACDRSSSLDGSSRSSSSGTVVTAGAWAGRGRYLAKLKPGEQRGTAAAACVAAAAVQL